MELPSTGSGPSDTEQELRERAVRRLKQKRELRDHVGWFILVNAVLWVIWALDDADTDDLWPVWVTGIWGVILLVQVWRFYRGPDEISEPEIAEEMNRLRKGASG